MKNNEADQSTTIRFGVALSALRMRAGMTQEQLASRAHCHRSYIADIERGVRNPSLKTIVRLLRAFGLQLCFRNGKCLSLLETKRWNRRRKIVTHRL